jgi:hypothetical protein
MLLKVKPICLQEQNKTQTMIASPQRMTDRDCVPDAKSVARWIGARNFKRWTRVVEFIEANYPGVFEPDWIYGGKKHGWGLRYKKSKSFCTLIPERSRFMLLIVFGVEERKKAEAVLPELKSHAQKDYVEAKTYHDGKWLGLLIDGDDVLADAMRLLTIKRKPKSS